MKKQVDMYENIEEFNEYIHDDVVSKLIPNNEQFISYRGMDFIFMYFMSDGDLMLLKLVDYSDNMYCVLPKGFIQEIEII